ncbi:hypothetical protein [Apilactobacillus xinyiensis]|uniref:hypothetical protein n=1 Tax=Apilactobacillus xinyiensis TaxID=2841032 RepID=UPI001C7D5739|nr:hypothetical protein [Apilactobacillus xinyiensis]
MLKKLNLSYKGTIFAYMWFLFTVYYFYLTFHAQGIKFVTLQFAGIDFATLINELFVAIMFLMIYLLFSMIPSRRGMLIPNAFLMFSVGQSFFYVILAIMHFNIVSLLISIVYAFSFMGLMYAYNLICFNVIDHVDGRGSYMYRWTAAMRVSFMKYWGYVVGFILLHALLTSMIMTSAHK